MRLTQVGQDFGNDALLRGGQRKRKFCDESIHRLVTVSQCIGTFGLCQGTQAAQAEVMSQQLFESETLLARMGACNELLDIRIRRWPMQVANGVGEGRQCQFVAKILRQQFIGRRARHSA